MCLLVVIRLVKEETYNIMQLLFIALHVLAGMPTRSGISSSLW